MKARTFDCPKRILVTGYFQRGNLGDNAMRDALLLHLKSTFPEAEVRCCPFPAFSVRRQPGSGLLIRSLGWADCVILAGGTHFHDRYGRQTVRILCTHLVFFLTARVFRAKVGFAGIGIGPLRTRSGRLLTRYILKLADAVLLRDRPSLALARSLTEGEKLSEGFDMTAVLPPPVRKLDPDCYRLGISVVPYFGAWEGNQTGDMAMVDSLASALQDFHRVNSKLEVRVLIFCDARHSGDFQLSQRLVSAIKPSVPVSALHCMDPEKMLQEIAGLDALIATRYHATMFGFLAGCPMLVVNYHDKCAALAEQIGLPEAAVLQPRDTLDPQALIQALLRMETDPSSYSAQLPVREARAQALVGLQTFDRTMAGLARDQDGLRTGVPRP